ncbi:MAG: hypothetical protein ABIE70_01245 [bacterium]
MSWLVEPRVDADTNPLNFCLPLLACGWTLLVGGAAIIADCAWSGGLCQSFVLVDSD